MLILINMDIMTMVLDFVHIQIFHFQLTTLVKTCSFLIWIIVPQRILIVEKKNISIIGEGPVDGLYDTTITSEVKYIFFNITRSRKKIYLSLH